LAENIKGGVPIVETPKFTMEDLKVIASPLDFVVA
jgi:hypothetical protein